MKSFSLIAVIFSVLFSFIAISCGVSNKTEQKQILSFENHSSNNSLDWQGVYRGVLPCADCEGIETRIVLKRDGTFQRSMKYLGESDKIFSDEGEFVWDNTGNKITLKVENGAQQYQVGENVLFHLDQQGNRVTGDLANFYKLLKNRVDPGLEDKKWVLIELRGRAVESATGDEKGFIQFSMETGRYFGNNTCNNFFGQYELYEGKRIIFGKAGSTMMAFPDMESQNLFMEVLQMAENYTVLDSILSLNKARMAPLARFRLDNR